MEADSINHLPRLDSFLSREKSFSQIGRAVWLEEMKRSKQREGGMLLGSPIRGVQNPHQNPKIGIFKMQPKIVAMLVLGAPEHLEFSLILQN